MVKNKSGDKLIDEAYEQAVRVLRDCSHRRGLKASALTKARNGYPQVWARDSMITLLGASFVDDKKIQNAIRASLDILRKNMSPLGTIPNNVDVRTLKANFQAYADGGAWFVIGNAALFERTGDIAFLKKNYPAVKKALLWYDYQDVDQSGLVSMQEASDWEDLFAVRGKGLYVNILRYRALRAAGFLAKKLGKDKDADSFLKKARTAREEINEHFWYKGDIDIFCHIKSCFGGELPSAEKIALCQRKSVLPRKENLQKESYYLPYLSFREFGEWFDSFGNLMAVLSGVAGKERSEIILNFIKKHKLAAPFPIKAIHPPIFPGEKDWRNYYRLSNLNLPNQYHNGGIWPFLGGFYIAALVKMKKHLEARAALEALARLNKKGKSSEWEFNEWFHGKTGKPTGMAEQAWSAGMYVHAYECVRKKKAFFF